MIIKKRVTLYKTLLSQISQNRYQKHLVVLQKLVFNVSTTSSHSNFESLCKNFMVLLMRSRDQSFHNNANATFNSLIAGTHQHDHQKLYKETQNLCGCWWWAHEQQVSEALSGVFVNSFSIFDLATFYIALCVF